MALLIFAIILSGAAMRLLNKMAADRVSIYAVIVISQVVGCSISLIFLLLSEHEALSVPSEYLLPIGASILLWSASVYLGWKGIRRSQLSVRESIIQSRLIFIPLFAVVFLGETISFPALLGTTLIILGISLAVYHPALHWRHPDVAAAGYVLAGSVVISVVSLLDKYIVSGVEAPLYSFFTYAGVLVMASLFLTKQRLRETMELLRSRHSPIVLGGATAMSLFFIGQLWLYSFLPLHVAYPLTQLASVFAIALAVILLGERDRLALKILGFIVAAAGGLLLKLVV